MKDFGNGLYALSDNGWQSAFPVTDAGVIVFDAPASYGKHIPEAVTKVTKQPIKMLIYSQDRKSTRLNSSHGYISYAVFCLKKKKIHTTAYNPSSSPPTSSSMSHLPALLLLVLAQVLQPASSSDPPPSIAHAVSSAQPAVLA